VNRVHQGAYPEEGRLVIAGIQETAEALQGIVQICSSRLPRRPVRPASVFLGRPPGIPLTPEPDQSDRLPGEPLTPEPDEPTEPKK
jgi:hypothetical protein